MWIYALIFQWKGEKTKALWMSVLLLRIHPQTKSFKYRFIYLLKNELVKISGLDKRVIHSQYPICQNISRGGPICCVCCQFGVVFAGAQKNIGPSGVVLVIVRRDLLGKPLPITPLVFDFTVMTKDNSLHNTPPTFGSVLSTS